jgi:hypothetical protein
MNQYLHRAGQPMSCARAGAEARDGDSGDDAENASENLLTKSCCDHHLGCLTPQSCLQLSRFRQYGLPHLA